MDEQPVVVLLGDSILMEGVALGLRSRLQGAVLQIDSANDGIAARLKSLQPAVIICELDCPDSDALLPLLKEQPGTLIISLQRGCCKVIVMQSSQSPIHSMHEFCQMVLSGIDARRPVGEPGDCWD
jgi:hypothetical protein